MTDIASLALDALTDTAAALVTARKMAQRPDLTPDDAAILRGILQPWWETETNASAMAEYLGNLGASPPGNPAHRRLMLVLLLCLAVARCLGTPGDVRIDWCIYQTEQWALGRPVMTPADITMMAQAYCDDIAGSVRSHLGKYKSIDGAVVGAIRHSVPLVAGCDGDSANHSVYRVAVAMAESAGNGPDSGRRAMAELANLIRAAVPVCPLAEVLP